MNNPEKITNMPLESFIELAEKNTDDGWKEIDQELSQVCNDQRFLDWAVANTANKESSLRDLAGTILEASDVVLTSDDIDNLKVLLEDKGYPGFRAACALAKRISQQEIQSLKNLIIEKLENFIDDEGVSEIANKYLESIGE